MLELQASDALPLCDSLSRRRALEIGALGTLGVGLPQLLRSQAHAESSTAHAGADATFGRARRVILFFMWGGPAHQDTWDLKPDGPVELRGEFRPTATNVPGLHISEHFPLLAQQADKLALIRSVGQEDNNHSTGAHAGLTGRRHELRAENFGARETDFPHYGSVLSKLRPNAGGLPTFVSLPEIIATTAGKITPGQDAGLLGKKYDPFRVNEHPDRPGFSVNSLALPESVSNLRMRKRRDLLSEVDRVARLADRSRTAQSMDDFYQRALDMVLSPKARKAFDLASVPDEERWRYGWHTFGQSTLLARRLIESGVKLVTVYWHREKKTVDSTWDTHTRNFEELKSRLMPSVDRPLAALLQDLEARGLLDETLIVWNSEFGRTPKINGRGGRDHWGPCNTVVMAGGGVPGGQVFGASDKAAAYPAADKVTQNDIAATTYRLLGVSPETKVHDRLNRPYPVALGEPIHKLLGGESRPEPKPAPQPRVDPPQVGPFRRMLRERGGRFLCCELGNPDGETEWKLDGWSKSAGDGLNRHRRIANDAASLRYTGIFISHLDYGYCAIRLAEPRPIDELALSVNGRSIPVPRDLQDAGPRSLWQIPLPDGLIKSSKSLELRIEAAGWPVTDIAVLGDRIRELHLERLPAFV